MRRVLVLNPTNESELNDFKALDIDINTVLNKYEEDRKDTTQFYRVLYTKEKGMINDYCTLDLTRDLKNCILTFSVMDQSKRTRPFIDDVISFAENIGSEEVMLSINPEDVKTIKILESDVNFSCFPIEDDDKSVLFIHEKVNELGSYGK